MKHNLIKTDNYLLVVDEKDKDFVVRSYGLYKNYKVGIVTLCNEDILEFEGECIDESNLSKIISHLPLNSSPILEGVDLLPPLEDDELDKIYDEVDYAYNDWKLFEKGYNKAKEKYKYTEEDMIEFANFKTSNLLKHHDEKGMYLGTKKVLELWKSLQHHPKYPIAFECEMEVGDYGDKDGLRKFVKTITNSQGRTEWVGKYVWE